MVELGFPVDLNTWADADGGVWWAAVHVVAKSRTQLSDFTFTFHFHALEKEMATHSSVLAWRIPGTAEPVGGSHRAGHDWSDLAAAAADIKIRELLEPQMKTFPYQSTTCSCVGILSLHVHFPLYLKELCLSKISDICPCFLRSGLLTCVY